MLSRYCFICSSWVSCSHPLHERAGAGSTRLAVTDRPSLAPRAKREQSRSNAGTAAGPWLPWAQADHTYQAPRRADMTKKIHVHLIDDLDASEASETMRFEVDGKTYEIDLSSSNAQKFRTEIAPYIAHARRVITQARRARPGRDRFGPSARPG